MKGETGAIARSRKDMPACSSAHLNPNERELWEVEKVEKQERGQVERPGCEEVEKT